MKSISRPQFLVCLVLQALWIPTKAVHIPCDDDTLPFLKQDIKQNVIPPSTAPQPTIPFIGHESLNASALMDLARRVYLENAPASVNVDPHLDGLIGRLHWHGKAAPLTDIFQVDVRVPWIRTCRPVVKTVKRLWEGIACGPTQHCAIEVTFSVADNYQVTESTRIETTISAGASWRGVEASVVTTNERFWEKIWGRDSESTVAYTWNLGPNEYCTPSMAHVELECDVDYYTVHYDTQYRRPQDLTRLDYSYNRKAPWDGNQWCYRQPVVDTPLRREQDWHEVLPDDGHGGNRGNIWKFPAPQMNQYRAPNPGGGSFNSDQIIISRQRGSGGDLQELFRCTRNPNTRRPETITIPLSSENNALQGFVGCVT